MTKAMIEEVEEWRRRGAHLEGQAVDMIVELCRRKMSLAGMDEDEGYLELMFKDEVKNYLMRQAINAKSYQMMIEKGVIKDVFNMQTDTMPSEVSKCRSAKTGAYLQQMQGRNIRGRSFLRRA